MSPNPTIGRGGRHAWLVSEAARLRARGAGEDDLAVALAAANVRDCAPPLPAGEVRGVLRWAMRRTARTTRDMRRRGGVAPATISRTGTRATIPGSPPAPPVGANPGAAAVWAQGIPVVDAPAVAAWLAGRGIGSADVADLDLARVLRAGAALPGWAWGPGGRWDRTGYIVILPTWDAAGRLAGLRARFPGRPAPLPKELAPAGRPVAGHVYADHLARRMLAGEANAIAMVWRVGMVIAEGATDYLAAAARCGTGEAAGEYPAVIGIMSGAWTADLAARVPDRATVTIATDPDPAGEGYAAEIARTLGGRCELRRWRPAVRA